MRALIRGVIVGAWVVASVGSTAASPPVEPALRAKVRAAALVTYIHGMTDDIAAKEIGPEGVPALLELLAEPDFPRRDNVVAFLAHLPSESSVEPLLRHLEQPTIARTTAEEDRALLLVPRALGLIAKTGDRGALRALLELTEPGGDGGAVGRAIASGRYGEDLKRGILEAAVRGLALVDRRSARRRVEELGSDGTRSVVAGVDLREAATQAAQPNETAGQRPALDGGEAAGLGLLSVDPSSRSHATDISFANHGSIALTPGVGMTDAELDALLAEANRIAERSDFLGDMACCHELAREAPGGMFGRSGDGLDIVDSLAELNAVVAASPQRVKVVRQINWCGGTATNIIGCSLVAGRGMTVVRLTGPEDILWLHEYGHNAGLGHVFDYNYVMYPYLTGYRDQVGLHPFECATLHAPAAASGSTLRDIGPCGDDDLDGVIDRVDICPGAYDPYQTDWDSDGLGDACENCPYASNPHQEDADADAVGDACDNCVDIPNTAQSNIDGDGAGDLCDACPADWGNDVDGDGLCGDSDVCPYAADPDQADADGDRRGDLCDFCADDATNDPDGDGICDDVDNCVPVVNPATAQWIARLPVYEGFGYSVDAAGDVDGDGYDDLVIGAPSHAIRALPYDIQIGAAYIFRGSPGGLQPDAAWMAVGTEAWGSFGAKVAGAGDVNADGYDDVLVSAVYAAPPSVSLYKGSASGLSDQPAWRITGPSTGVFGFRIGALGDVNRDGFDDVYVGAAGAVLVFLGSASGLPAAPSQTLDLGPAAGLDCSDVLAPVGDVNGDGFDDFACGNPQAGIGDLYQGGAVHVFYGRTTGLTPFPEWSSASQPARLALGSSLAAVGDVDGDGFDDFVAGAPGYATAPGARATGSMMLYHGSLSRLSEPQTIWPIDFVDWNLGHFVAGAGDLNGDGHADLIDAVATDHGSSIDVRLGRATGFGGRPDWRRGASGATDDQRAGAAGDVNGDGYADLFVRHGELVYVYAGSANGLSRGQADLDGDGLGDPCDDDWDGDQVANVYDDCPRVPNADQADRDEDGPGDLCDNCPDASNVDQADLDRDGLGDACDGDDDADGVPDGSDNCPTVSNADQLNPDGDGDGSACDACPSIANSSQSDSDYDGRGDDCDNCPGLTSPDQSDVDGDGRGAPCDDCPSVANPEQSDVDRDSVGDACDVCPLTYDPFQVDLDGDRIGQACDNCPGDANPDQANLDGDLYGDACDTDDDGDGVLDPADNCPRLANPTQADVDRDGLGDACDGCTDADGDGFGVAGSTGCPSSSVLLDCMDTNALVYPGAFDACDGLDNDCNGLRDDALCSDFVFASYERVDGFTLGALGRAFGQCSASPAGEWWNAVEYTGDRCVDGEDLAVLGAIWACMGDTPICP